ncbi:Proteasome-associated ATPase [Symmachiella dynata]|uniref:Proteasome-associated ATPase n=1 Tax=Symmachiella dynata TaxID=2527995 RepID=A0A517ZL75_9PLAN|nr:ATPase [Symmachiella dynata]QDU43244.1 Proteasome-associated ATPase [Symmachiella dynata]
MIDHRRNHPETPSSESETTPPERAAGGAITDLYGDLFEKKWSMPKEVNAIPRSEASPTAALPAGEGIPSIQRCEAPSAPRSLEETGLALMQVCDLILKQLYLQGGLLGLDLAKEARLPFNVVDEALRFLKDEKCIEVATGELIGRVSYKFHLTDLGRNRARDAFEQCRYMGPAPVALEDYVRQCHRQSVVGMTCNATALMAAFENMIIRPNLMQELGPAVCSGRSIFIYGPPGNGKTMIAKGLGNFLNSGGGEIYVPYAIQTENSVITVFDPTLHDVTDNEDDLDVEDSDESMRLLNENTVDRRWRRVRRPVVITGGELTLEMLDLRYNSTANFYQAPLHIKANGGVFLIDDFGRQIVSPRDLLNRWILPLEEREDYLTLTTGKKFSVPFEQLIIFSTNLDPRELVDEAFLRRIRHKIQIGPPSRELYTEIFELSCKQRGIPFAQPAVDYLYRTFYDAGKPPRSSDPRDLLEICQSICRFEEQEVVLSEDLISEAAQRFFCQI